MTERQKRFADEYIIDLNATRAYKTAYPNVKKDSTAQAAGARLLLNVMVKNYIEQRLTEIHNKKTADLQEVMELLTNIIRNKEEQECRDMFGKAYKRTPTLKERLVAAELIGKRYGAFSNKVELSGSVETGSGKLDQILEELKK